MLQNLIQFQMSVQIFPQYTNIQPEFGANGAQSEDE